MKRSSTIIAVASGKGGVGKSVISVNMAEILVTEGYTVALLDADLGQGACAILLNETPKASILDLIRHRAVTRQVLHKTSSGVTFVQAVAEVGEADGQESRLYDTMDELLIQLREKHEFVIIDTPAGTDGAVRWALDRADLGVLTIVGEPTAIADAYRLAKMVWKADPNYPFATVVNFSDTENEATSVAERFGQVTSHFTGRLPNYLGWVPFSASVRYSVMEQKPVVRSEGPVRLAFQKLIRTLVNGRVSILQPLNI